MDIKKPTLNLNVNRYRSMSNAYDDEEFCVHFLGSIPVTTGSTFSEDIKLPDYIPLDVFRNPNFSRCFIVLKKLTIADYIFTSGELSILHIQYVDATNQTFEIGYFHSDKKSEFFNLNMIVGGILSTPNPSALGKIVCTSVDHSGTHSQDIFISANFSIIYQIELLEAETKVEKFMGELGKRVQHWEETFDFYFKANCEQ